MGKNAVGLSLLGQHDLPGKKSEVGRGRPQPGRRHLRIDVPFARQHASVRTMTGGRPAGKGLRQGLLIGALAHVELDEHRVANDIGKWPAQDIDEELLQDGVPAARIPETGADLDVHLDGRCVSRFDTFENLLERRQLLPLGIAGETGDGETRGMTQQLTECYFPLSGPCILRDFPRAQPRIDILVEAEDALLDVIECGRGGYGLADRGCLEQGLGRHGARSSGFPDPVSFFPLDRILVDNRDAQARNTVDLHPFHQARLAGWLPFDNNPRVWDQAVLDPLDARRHVLRVIRGCA